MREREEEGRRFEGGRRVEEGGKEEGVGREEREVEGRRLSNGNLTRSLKVIFN